MQGKARILKDKSIYPGLHKQVFNVYEETPEVVIVGETKDGIIGGFISGHWELDGTFFIEYSGVLPEFQKKGWLRYIHLLLDPCVNYITSTQNTNTVAMKTLLSVGFIPIGCRHHHNLFWIEWIRRGVKNG